MADDGENDDVDGGGDDVEKVFGSSSDGGGKEGGVIWFEGREGLLLARSLAGFACFALLCFANLLPAFLV